MLRVRAVLLALCVATMLSWGPTAHAQPIDDSGVDASREAGRRFLCLCQRRLAEGHGNSGG